MSCANQTLKGIGKPCEGSMGGIIEVYITNWQDGLYSIDSGTSEVSGITTGISWYVYHFRPNSSSLSQASTIDPTNGTNYITTTVNLVFSRMDTEKRVELNALKLAELAVIVKDANGKYYALGEVAPVVANSVAGESGTARSDGNRYTLVIEDTNPEIPAFIPKSVIDTLTLVENNGQ